MTTGANMLQAVALTATDEPVQAEGFSEAD